MHIPRQTAPLWRRPAFWLVVVAVVHALSPLILLGAHWGFGADETVYLSQINGHLPPEYYSAPRARGATFIAAPVTLLTSSVAAVRIWVAALSGLALWMAFAPWLKLVRGWIVPVAALAFASIWTTIFYGFEVMPNEWVAFATLGAAGVLLRYLGDGRRRHLWVLAVAVAIIGLMRPSDAAFAAAGLGLAALAVRESWRRRLTVIAVLAIGVFAGVIEWVIEAETSFGGLHSRIHVAQAEQGGSGLFWSGGAQVRALAGPLLCRAGCHVSAGAVYRLWWVVLAVLVVAAVAGALVRRTDRRVVLLPVFVGLVVAAQYLLTVPYAAPRFLQPAYAMLAVPAMIGARELVRLMPRPVLRTSAAAVLVIGLVLSAAVQVRALTVHVKPPLARVQPVITAQAAALRAAGVVPSHCQLHGSVATKLQLTYALGCTDDTATPESIRAGLDDGQWIIWFRRQDPQRIHGGTWKLVRVPGDRHGAWVSQGRPRGKAAPATAVRP